MTRDYTGYPDHQVEVPLWGKAGVVLDLSQSTAPSIYWPWIVDTAQVHPSLSLVERWRMYYSTDHHGTGGIYLATAPDPTGPWTDQGLVYLDTTLGASTETPSVVWDPAAGVWRMWYQQAHVPVPGQQSTLLATSADGLTWTRQGVAISVSPGAWPGDGHAGYMIPHRIGGQWTAYHLLGGGDHPGFGISHSADGVTWQTDPRPLYYGMDQTQQVWPGSRIEWNHGHVVQFRGVLWWIGILSSFGSGGGSVARRLAQAPLASDLRHLLGVPRLIWPADPPANIRALHVLHDLDRLLLTYQIDNTFYQAVTAWS